MPCLFLSQPATTNPNTRFSRVELFGLWRNFPTLWCRLTKFCGMFRGILWRSMSDMRSFLALWDLGWFSSLTVQQWRFGIQDALCGIHMVARYGFRNVWSLDQTSAPVDPKVEIYFYQPLFWIMDVGLWYLFINISEWNHNPREKIQKSWS